MEWLGPPLRQGVAAAGGLGVSGVEFDAVGELSPLRLSATGRREIAQLVRGHDLRVAALGCSLRHGLDSPVNQEARIDYLKAALTLSHELGARLVLVRAGAVPPTPDAPGADSMREALAELCRHGDRVGAALALDAGADASVLAEYLAGFDTGGLGIALDPAALVSGGAEPAQSARDLGRWTRYVLARDARRGTSGLLGRETALGAGDVDWPALLGVLDQIGYGGWVTVRRDQPAASPDEAAAAVAFLHRLGVQCETGLAPRHQPGSRQERT